MQARMLINGDLDVILKTIEKIEEEKEKKVISSHIEKPYL